MPKIITRDDVIKRLAEKNPTLQLLGEYKGMLNKTQMRCTVCGYEWDCRIAHLLRGHGCPNCNGSRRKTNKEFCDAVYEINSNIEILDSYVNYNAPIRCKCLVCDNIWTPQPAVLLRGGGCPKCAWKNNGLKLKNTHDAFIKKMEKNNPDIEVLGKYNGDRVKIPLRCKKCSFEWNAMPNNISNKKHTGCPHCNSSKGEKEIERYLQLNNYNYQPQYSFPNLGRKKFDFAVFDKTHTLLCLIEYDGEQHYKPVDFGGKGEEWALHHFQDTQKRDAEKTNYCLENNIKLIRIPYFKDVFCELDENLRGCLQ